MNIVNRTITWVADAMTAGAISDEMQRAYYEGAKSTRLNRDFNVTNDHFELQSGGDRDMLKARARWLSANNPITKSIDKSIIKNVIGTGIKLQSKIKDKDCKNAKDINDKLESLWKEFSKKENFDNTGRHNCHKFQKLALKTKMTDGETIINKVWGNDKKFPLKFQLIESDQFDTMIQMNGNNKVFSGVEIDKNGKPIAYHLKTGINSFDSRRFDSDKIIHFYDSERVTQYRGVSDYAQTINNLKDFAAVNDNVIVKSRIQSAIGLIIKTNDKAKNMMNDISTGKKNGEATPIKEITAGMVKYLKPGEEMQSFQSTQPGSEYPEFVITTIRLIAAGRDISYELAFRDFSKVNFSSARASIIQDNKRFDDEQAMMIDDVLNPMFEAFVDSQVLVGSVKMPSDYWSKKEKYIKPTWIKPKREWADPLRDVKTIEKEIDLNMSTQTKAAALKGEDIEDIMDEKIHEEKMWAEKRAKAGLNTDESEGE